MEPKNTNTELIPRSIFKGKNSDGTLFTVNEWAPNSIGNAPDIAGCSVIIAGCFLTAIIAPITFLSSLFLNLHRSVNLIGALFGIYFIVDCYKNWLMFLGIQIFVSNETTILLMHLTVAAIVGNIAVMILSEIFIKPVTIILSLTAAIIGLIYYQENIENIPNIFEYQKHTDSYLYPPETDMTKTNTP
jgi:hypothetical protein